MRIAQVAPLYESVPPRLYGGTERVVSYLTDELVRQGHQVTLFASGDSVTRAELVAGWPSALRLDTRTIDSLAAHFVLLERVQSQAHRFDVIHYHVDYLHFPWSLRARPSASRPPHVTTLHGRLDIPELVPLHEAFAGAPVVSISNAQREPLPWLAWQATIHHGLPPDLFRFEPVPGAYLAFLGRISPEKRVDRAIEIARAVDMPLRIAAKVDHVDRDYFEARIRPCLDDPRVEFIGEIGDAEKGEFLGNARALLFPIDWPEPFGLVMIESLACGTPVVAYRRGSVPEVLEHGVTGFMVGGRDEAIAAVRAASALDRGTCRAVFEQRFSAARMARDYVRVYEDLIAAARGADPLPRRSATSAHDLVTPGNAAAGSESRSGRAAEREE